MSKPRRPDFFPRMKYRARVRHSIYNRWNVWDEDWNCVMSYMDRGHNNEPGKRRPKPYPRRWNPTKMRYISQVAARTGTHWEGETTDG